MVSLSQTYFSIAPVSSFRVIVLVELLSNACLYELNLGGTGVLSIEFNEIFLLLLFTTLGTLPQSHYGHKKKFHTLFANRWKIYSLYHVTPVTARFD